MDTTKQPRVKFPVYLIEHDDFHGRLRVRPSFTRLEQPIMRHYHEGTDLVEADTMDGGQSGWITAPAGSTIGETEDDSSILVMPNGSTLTPREAYDIAHNPKENQYFGLGWITGKSD